MPFDSMPISLAGFRLATMTIVPADERLGLVGLGDAGDDRALLGADVDRSFSSFFDFGTRSAASTFATRSSTFMKSSMAIRVSSDGAAAGAPSACGDGAGGAAASRVARR